MSDLISRLERADEYEPLGHDGWEAAEEIKRLRAALEPFSWLPIGLTLEDPDEIQVYQCHGWPKLQWAVVTAGDYRRARETLE